MANKRMFSLSVIDTDAFIEMPQSSRLLYYELGMRADDDGFVDSWKKIIRFAGLSEDDMKVLIAKKFIIPFDSGVIVIRHWRLNNYLRNDRHQPTMYQKEKAMLCLEDDVYELESTEKSTMLPSGSQVVDLDKNSIDIDIVKEKNIKKRKETPTLEEIEEYIKEKSLNVSAKQFFDYFETGGWVDSRGNKVKNWKQKLLTWNKFSPPPKEEEVSTKFFDPNDQYSNIDFLIR